MTLNLKSKEFNFFYQGPRRALGIKAPFFPEFVGWVGTYLPDLALKKTHAIWLSEHDPQSLDGPIQQPTPLGETQFIAHKWDPDQSRNSAANKRTTYALANTVQKYIWRRCFLDRVTPMHAGTIDPSTPKSVFTSW